MKKAFKTFSVFMVLVLLFTTLCSVNIFADTTNLRYFERGVLTDGTNTAYYIIDKDNKTLYITGDGISNGRTPDYPNAESGPFAGRTDVTKIVIEEDVERVGDYVCANMTAVDTLEIQSNLLSSDSNMSSKAMIGCTGLRNIQADSSLVSTNVLLEVIKGAVNIASGNWLSLIRNGISVVQTGVNGDGSLDNETVKAMVNDYIMTNNEVFLGDLEQAITSYEERIANPCYYDNQYHHLYGRYVSTAPTCTQNGEYMYICSTCYHTYYGVAPATGHTFTESVMFEPTCTQEGIMKHTCTTCGTKEFHEIAPLGHTDGEWVISEKPTRTKVGKAQLHCSVCDETIKQANVSYLVGLNINAHTVANLKAQNTNSSRALIILDQNGEVLPDSAKVGTGCIIKYVSATNPNTLYEVASVILYGDVNGDGLVNTTDKQLVYDEAFVAQGTIDNDSVYYIAADMNRDTVIDAFDCFLQDGVATGGRSFNQSVSPYN